MSAAHLQSFLGWCTVINIVVLLLSSAAAIRFRQRIAALHGRLFSLDPRSISLSLYVFLAAYKLLIVFFNLVPWVALGILR